MLLHHHDVLNQNTILLGDDTQDAALLALVFTGNNFDPVVPLDLDLAACHDSLSCLDDLYCAGAGLRDWRRVNTGRN
jgi:hypothetical protein